MCRDLGTRLTYILMSAVIMSKVLVSVSLLSSGVGNGRGAGGVAEGGDWREGEITGFSHLANCMTYIATVYSRCNG